MMLPPATRVYLACGFTDMRKGFDGLAAIVQTGLSLDPYLCLGRDYVAEAAWRQPGLATRGSLRHIIIRCLPAVGGPSHRAESVGCGHRGRPPSRGPARIISTSAAA
jgi:hypothetical protein